MLRLEAAVEKRGIASVGCAGLRRLEWAVSWPRASCLAGSRSRWPRPKRRAFRRPV